MFGNVNELEWLDAMRKAALPAIQLAAQQMGDPDAARAWEESEHLVNFSRPSFISASLSFSRPNAGGEIPEAGENAMTFDYLPYLIPRSNRLNPLVDGSIRRAVLHQIRGRMRDAETAHLSPGEESPAWSCTLDVMTWHVLTQFLSQDEIATLVSQPLTATDDPDDRPPVAIEREWHPLHPGPDALGLHHCNLVPDMGTLATDGLEFRLGGAGSPVMRVESTSGRHVYLEIRGIALPETAITHAVGRPLSKILDDPALLPASRLLTVREVSNRMHKDEAILSITCDEVRIRCAPAPVGATFAWENLRDTAAAIPRALRVLDHGALTN